MTLTRGPILLDAGIDLADALVIRRVYVPTNEDDSQSDQRRIASRSGAEAEPLTLRERSECGAHARRRPAGCALESSA